jgi:TnpA family transposase
VGLRELGRTDRTFDDQRPRASRLNLVVAAIVYWSTIYLEQAVATHRAAGPEVPDDLLRQPSLLG